MSQPVDQQLKAWIFSECGGGTQFIDSPALQKLIDSKPDSFYQGDNAAGLRININDFSMASCRPHCNFTWTYDQGSVTVKNAMNAKGGDSENTATFK